MIDMILCPSRITTWLSCILGGCCFIGISKNLASYLMIKDIQYMD